MKAKILICAVVAGCMFGAVAFGQTLQITGKLLPATNATAIVVQSGPEMKLPCASGTWVITVTPTTTVSPSPAPSPGSTVAVTCKSPDAQTKEQPNSAPCPSPTPTPPTG